MLVQANERAAPESIRALNLFPAYTVTGVSLIFITTERDSSGSLKDQCHCLNLMKNLKGNPGW